MDTALLKGTAMRILILMAIVLLVGCRGKKEIVKEYHEIRDTIFIRDTFTRTVLDSVFMYKTITIGSDVKERNDSIIIRTVKDTVIIRKYGTSKQTTSQSKELEELRRVISDLTEINKETSSIKNETKGKEPSKKKWSLWKWVAIFEGGAILILLGFSGMKYFKLINFSFFGKK
jgi:hypothetical protein